jgi:hypothetical protein
MLIKLLWLSKVSMEYQKDLEVRLQKKEESMCSKMHF